MLVWAVIDQKIVSNKRHQLVQKNLNWSSESKENLNMILMEGKAVLLDINKKEYSLGCEKIEHKIN